MTSPQPFPAAKTALLQAMRRGVLGRCPCCGEGRIFAGYIAPAASCESCGLDLARYRTDDAPSYFTILIVGHMVVPLMLALEMARHPPAALQLAVWLPATLLLTLVLLPRVKGALVGLLWSLGVRE
jgi:uncharacterized protein (DUF983 family)